MIIDIPPHNNQLSPTFLIGSLKLLTLLTCFILGSFFFLDKICIASSYEARAVFFLVHKAFSPAFWLSLLSSILFYVRFILKNEKKSRPLFYLTCSLGICTLASYLLTPLGVILSYLFANQSCFILGGLIGGLATLIQKARLFLSIGSVLLCIPIALSGVTVLSSALFGVAFGTIIAQIVFKRFKQQSLL